MSIKKQLFRGPTKNYLGDQQKYLGDQTDIIEDLDFAKGTTVILGRMRLNFGPSADRSAEAGSTATRRSSAPARQTAASAASSANASGQDAVGLSRSLALVFRRRRFLGGREKSPSRCKCLFFCSAKRARGCLNSAVGRNRKQNAEAVPWHLSEIILLRIADRCFLVI